MIQLTNDPIDFTALTEQVRSNAAGAVVLFLGTVREFTHARIETQAASLAEETPGDMKLAVKLFARARWPIVKAAIVHRLGTMELGDISVAVAVSTPHRDQAFEAGRWLIDTLKEVVPIWKQENWDDGTKEWIHPGLKKP
ncbi:MAG: molybdenum cofactor biosynthesis protein MoaE [Planctomycetota bacterium]|nr:molybdenum cofactor biosynthesis protein MoaE [Planctomycetota bacterium]